MRIVAIDQSTTSTTSFLFDGTSIGQKLRTDFHKQTYPQPGWVEHDGAELLRNVQAGIEAGRAAGAQAIALSNQGESCLAWDAQTGQPISPVLVWQDSRTEEQCQRLAKEHGAAVEERARLPLDAYFSASKMGWIYANVPAARELAAAGRLRMGTTDAFFRDRLTGRFETDVATASRMALMNMETCIWDPFLCEVYGVPIETLPAITDCSGDLGAVNGLPVRSAIVDQQAALFGHGVTRAGQVKVTFGTGAFALALTGEACPAYENGVLPTVAWREVGQATHYALDGGIHTASAAVNWAKGLGLFTDYAELNGFEGHALGRGLAFVPSLTGLACPYWDHHAKGSWLGLTLGTGNRDMMQAMLEGIAYRTREVLEAMNAMLPLVAPVHIDGGMTANPWFAQALANISGFAIQKSTMVDITAFGVAQLAARACGDPLVTPEEGKVLLPEPDFIPLPETFAKACEIVGDWGAATSL